jgi:hypothetical protein
MCLHDFMSHDQKFTLFQHIWWFLHFAFSVSGGLVTSISSFFQARFYEDS